MTACGSQLQEQSHRPACWPSQWPCPRRAAPGPRPGSLPPTRRHTGGAHSTDLQEGTQGQGSGVNRAFVLVGTCSTCGVKQGLDAEVMGEANRSKLLHKLRGRLCQPHHTVCFKEHAHTHTHTHRNKHVMTPKTFCRLFLLPAGSEQRKGSNRKNKDLPPCSGLLHLPHTHTHTGE